MCRPLFPWVAAFAAVATPLEAQQVLEIDFANGRKIINDELGRAMQHDLMDVDWQRNVLYISDVEEPNGIMAFSLETGEWLRTVSTPRGDGPHEFSQGRRAVSVAAHGGLYVSGLIRVVEFDIGGVPLSSWRPATPTTWKVCDFGGAPAVVTQGGVVRRGSDDMDEEIGNVRARGEQITAPRESLAPLQWRIMWSRITCAEDRAYAVISSEHGTDSVFVYRRDGTEGMVALPTEGIEGMMECRPVRGYARPGTNDCPVGLSMLSPSLDDLGNLVLLGIDNRVHGIVINPETGCHALIRNTTRLYNIPTRIYADSALVFHSATVEVEVDGQKRLSFRDTAYGVSIAPLRRVSGEPCPGMLPSVR